MPALANATTVLARRRRFGSTDHMTPNHIHISGIATLQPFYKKLDDEIFESFRKKNVDLASI